MATYNEESLKWMALDHGIEQLPDDIVYDIKHMPDFQRSKSIKGISIEDTYLMTMINDIIIIITREDDLVHVCLNTIDTNTLNITPIKEYLSIDDIKKIIGPKKEEKNVSKIG